MEVGDIFNIAMIFVVTGIGVGYGLSVLVDVRDDLTDATAQTALNNTIDGVDNFPEKLPLLATILIAALIIGVLIKYMGAR